MTDIPEPRIINETATLSAKTGIAAQNSVRFARLYAACEAAIDRLAAKESDGIAPDTFAETGEALFWLFAISDEGRGPRLNPGLQWARHQYAHGLLLTDVVDWHYGTDLGRWVLGKGELGTSSGYRWLERSRVQQQTGAKSHPRLEAAYDRDLAGQPVLDTLRRELARFGSNPTSSDPSTTDGRGLSAVSDG